MLDPITAISVASTCLRGIKGCIDNSEAIFKTLSKYAGAIEDAREHVRLAKQYGQKKPNLYGKLESAKTKNATEQAFDIIIMEEKIRQHEEELYNFFAANWCSSWGGRAGWLKFRKLRESIRAEKVKCEYASIRRRKQFLYNTKLGTALAVLLLVLLYLCWFLYNAIIESAK